MTKLMGLVGVIAAAWMLGCASEETLPDDDPAGAAGAGGMTVDTSIDVLGAGTHDPANVVVTTIASNTDGLNGPRDLAFNPAVPGQLWVVDVADDSIVILTDAGQPGQTARKAVGATGGQHFLANPTGLAFGAPGTFATIHEEDQLTQGEQTPADFMGPTLWTSDAATFDGGDNSHIDMLHNSPLGMGIAWERDNIFWVFDGFHSSVARYDFGVPHELGGVDHTDGTITRYAEGDVARQPGVPSGLFFHLGRLYIADSAHGRLVTLDPAGAVPTGAVTPNYDGCTMNRVDNVDVVPLIDGRTVLTVWNGIDIMMPVPTGVAIHNVLVGGVAEDVLFVSDISTSTIYGFSLDGELLDWVNLGLPGGSVGGIEVDAAGDLWVADALGQRVLRVQALHPEG
jgi:hypothetical protein